MLSGLVLSGGGARAAYQAGVLRGVSDIVCKKHRISQVPFRIFTGESAGAINSGVLATHIEDFDRGTERLWQYWENLRFQHVFKTNPVSVLGNAARWMRELSFGGAFRSKNSVSLFNTSPLHKYLKDKIDFQKIQNSVFSGELRGIAVSTTNYATASTVTFFDGDESVRPWLRAHRIAVRVHLKLEHVLASTAIPILFPPVRIGETYYGDGSIRMRTPMSPAIHLGAKKILAIGLRHYRSLKEVEVANYTMAMPSIALADVGGVLLNAGFLDNLEADLERMERINETLQLMPEKVRAELPSKLQVIPVLTIRPSEDLGLIAWREFDRFTSMLRHLLRGLGASRSSGWDLVSYLAFDRAYARKLLELGYQDAINHEREIVDFFAA
jgi:NTE family protein